MRVAYGALAHIMRTVLISTYELGRQPFGLASPAAWLQAGWGRRDLCRSVAAAVPTQTWLTRGSSPYTCRCTRRRASRLPVIERVRRLNRGRRVCAAYGLYAPLNAALSTGGWASTHILGGEFEADLVDVALGRGRPPSAAGGDGPTSWAPPDRHSKGRLPRLAFITPDRLEGLPPLGIDMRRCGRGAARKVVGYTEASRGCKHVLPPLSGGARSTAGSFRVVQPADVVLADVAAQTRAGRRAHHVW